MVLNKQLKKNRKKGFTLVEVIVVLVILAILAAIAIPALTGYIDKANEKAVISQTRTAVIAVQTLVSEGYGSNKNITASGISLSAIKKLTGDNSIGEINDVYVSGHAVYQLSVKAGSKTGYFYVTGGATTYSTTTSAYTWPLYTGNQVGNIPDN
jgi:type IV pilus assembly protein PilA